MEKNLLRLLVGGSWVGLIVAFNYGIPASETETIYMVNGLWAAVSVVYLVSLVAYHLAETLWGLALLTILVVTFWGIVAAAATTGKEEHFMLLIPVGAAILMICIVRYAPKGGYSSGD